MGPDVTLVKDAIQHDCAVLPIPVVMELLSNPRLQSHNKAIVMQAQTLPMENDIWYRAAEIRSMLISRGLKAKVPDILIAQSCIDADVPLITADVDFEKFAEFGLRVMGL